MAEDSSSLSTQRNDAPAEYGYPTGLAHARGQCGYRALLEVADLIVGAESLPELFQELAPRVQMATGCEFVSFSLHDSGRNSMLTHYFRRDQGSGELEALAAEDCASGWVWLHQEAMAIPDLEREQRFTTSLQGVRELGVRAYSLLPISTPQHRYGALGLGKSEPAAVDMHDVEFLWRVAAMVALVMENQETHRAWEAQQDRLQSLVAISRELRSTLDQKLLEPIIFANLRRILNYDDALLGLLEEGNRILRMQAVDAMPESELLFEGRCLLLAEAPSAQAIEERRVTYFNGEDLDKLATPVTKEMRRVGIESVCNVPLLSGSQVLGALSFSSRRSNAFHLEDAGYLQQVGDQIAAALDNCQAYCEIAQLRDRLQSVVAISRELSSSLELEGLIPIIFANLRRIINYDCAFLGMLEEDNRFLRMHAVDPMPGSELMFEGRRVVLAEMPAAQAIEKRRVTVFSGEELDKLGTPFMKEIRRNGIESICNMPLLSGGQVLGSLNFHSCRSNAFHPEDTEYLQQVADQIAAALDNARAYREIAELRDRVGHEKRYLESEITSEIGGAEIVGNSPALKNVLGHAGIVAATDSTVLITGETGTGKEQVARAIHNMSRRKERSFIKLNCASIPTGLLESELFGHEKGAFTGAVSQKVGRLELADKGTLFLDEIGEIPLELQPKLLRVLQDYEFERLGGTRTIHVDARLIAATNRDLARAVEEKQFRSDLFYRLHVFPLRLPTLRERREDIPLLVRYFVDRCAARMGKRIEFIPDEAIEAMLNWKWPGNIRELENFIERSVILSEGNRLRPPLAELQQETSRFEEGVDDTLRSRERDHIIAILRQTRGLLSGPGGAAARLGMKRTTLQYRIQKLGISRMDYLE
jgi:formate hydrogenlyase transcriptional activator